MAPTPHFSHLSSADLLHWAVAASGNKARRRTENMVKKFSKSNEISGGVFLMKMSGAEPEIKIESL